MNSVRINSKPVQSHRRLENLYIETSSKEIPTFLALFQAIEMKVLESDLAQTAHQQNIESLMLHGLWEKVHTSKELSPTYFLMTPGACQTNFQCTNYVPHSMSVILQQCIMYYALIQGNPHTPAFDISPHMQSNNNKYLWSSENQEMMATKARGKMRIQR